MPYVYEQWPNEGTPVHVTRRINENSSFSFIHVMGRYNGPDVDNENDTLWWVCPMWERKAQANDWWEYVVQG